MRFEVGIMSLRYTSLLVAMLTLLFGCAKEDTIEGPELQDIFGEFDIIDSLDQNLTSVDFAAGEEIIFTASLSIRTPWKLEVKSLSSTASKVIEGNEREILNDVASWDGSITFAPLFQSGEQVLAMMTFENYTDTMYSDTITIVNAKEPSAIGQLISDFEDPGQGFVTFAELGGTNQIRTGAYAQSNFEVPPTFLALNSAEGSGYWHTAANNINSVFINGFLLSAENIQGNTRLEFGTQQPSKIWFNAFVFGFGNENATLTVGFQEDDNLDGSYDRFSEGEYLYTIPIDWFGWKLVSFNLGQTNISTSGGFGNIDGTGNKDVDRIINVEFLSIAQEGSSGLTGYCIDYMNFTEQRPWTP